MTDPFTAFATTWAGGMLFGWTFRGITQRQRERRTIEAWFAEHDAHQPEGCEECR